MANLSIIFWNFVEFFPNDFHLVAWICGHRWLLGVNYVSTGKSIQSINILLLMAGEIMGQMPWKYSPLPMKATSQGAGYSGGGNFGVFWPPLFPLKVIHFYISQLDRAVWENGGLGRIWFFLWDIHWEKTTQFHSPLTGPGCLWMEPERVSETPHSLLLTGGPTEKSFTDTFPPPQILYQDIISFESEEETGFHLDTRRYVI